MGTGRAGRLGTQSAEAAAARGVRMYKIELMLYPKNSATISVDPFKVIAFCVAWRDMAQFRS